MKRQKKKPTSRLYFDYGSSLSRILFFLLILLLPTQLGKHFFLPFSYLSGIRADYLSPTLYLIDVVIFFLASLNIKTVFRFLVEKIGWFFLGVMALNIIFAQSLPLSLYGAARIIEFLIVIALGKKLLAGGGEKLLLTGLFIGASVELLLSILQFVFKHSLQGPFYFIGERLFSLSTPGIAKITFSGVELLRPYGSFSHPNSLAGFYLLIYFFVLTQKKFEKYFWLKYLLLFVSTLLVFVSFSKVAIITFLILNALYLILHPKISCRICVVARLAVMFVVAAIFLMGQGDPLTVQKRLELITNAWTIIKKYPLFGVGFDNYLIVQSSFVSKFPMFFNQPVHNIFLLLAGEAGLVLTGFVLYFFRKLPVFLLLVLAATGLFDHYWLTLIQNFLLLGVVYSITLEGHGGPVRLRH